MEQSKMIIKRNLLFWGKYGIQMTAILIGFVLLYGLFFSMGESADSGFWQSANFFAVLIGIIVTVAVVMGIGAGFIMGSDLADTLTAWFQGQSGSVISMGLLIGAVVAAALYAVSLVMMLRVVSKYEVRV